MLEFIGVVVICGVVLVGIFKHAIGTEEKETAPEPVAAPDLASPHGLADCFAYILNLLDEAKKGRSRWRVTTKDQDLGRIVADLEWDEFFGDQAGELERNVNLEVTLVPIQDGSGATAIYLKWKVKSPLNRAGVNEVMDGMKEAIRHNLQCRTS